VTEEGYRDAAVPPISLVNNGASFKRETVRDRAMHDDWHLSYF